MSFEWTAEPLSIQSIASQYTLPVAIRSAPGFRGSSRPIILHSISRTTFAFGRALRVSQSSANDHVSYRPIDSELVAVPINYPGYFECLPSRSNRQQAGVTPETHIRGIVERMQVDHRPQAFYTAAPMRAYTVETNDDGVTHRVWQQIEANQIILFDKLVHIEYTPKEDDDLTDDDYALSWWFCFGKQILSRNEEAFKCILSQQQICYVPCALTDELNLIPVGQRGSSNVNKLQTIHNLIEQFPMPVNIKLAQLPGSYTYKDFNGNLQLSGSRAEEFAVCASLSSSNICVVPTKSPLKFVVAPLPASSSQIRNVLSSCQIFVQSFDMQIRRILITATHRDTSSHRSRARYPKVQATTDDPSKRYKRSQSMDQRSSNKDDQTTATTTTADEGYRSSSSAAKKRSNFSQQRAVSVDLSNNNSRQPPRKQTLSTDEDAAYNLLVHPVRAKRDSLSSSPPPPALPKKPHNYPFPPASSSRNGENHLTDEIDSANADGAILMDATNELFIALPSDTRFT